MNKEVIHNLIVGAVVFLMGVANSLAGGNPESADTVTAGASEIRAIRVASQEDAYAVLEIDYYYDGSSGLLVPLTVESESTGTREKLASKQLATLVRHGQGTARCQIYRPMQKPWEAESVSIRALLGDEEKGGVLAVREMESPVMWEPAVPERISSTLEYMAMQATSAFTGSKYRVLDDMFEEWNDSSLRTRDGKWRLDALLDLKQAMDFEHADRTLARLSDWEKQNPKSSGVAIATAMFWVGYAWHARGSGYADSITETGWRLFKERLTRAEQVLIEAKDTASDNPLWYTVYLQVARGLDWEKSRLLGLFAEAVEREPQYYWNYFTTVIAVSPKWGGSIELMDLVANSAAEHTRDIEGEVLYARVYWSISGALGHEYDIFRDTPVSWPRMKQGFRELLDEYPDSDWNLNNFTAFACRAGDKETYLELRRLVGEDRIQQKAWKRDYTIESCDGRFMHST